MQYLRQFVVHTLMSLIKVDSVISGKHIIDTFRTVLYKSHPLFLGPPVQGTFKSAPEAFELLARVKFSVLALRKKLISAKSTKEIENLIKFDLRSAILSVVKILTLIEPFAGLTRLNYFAKCDEFIR